MLGLDPEVATMLNNPQLDGLKAAVIVGESPTMRQRLNAIASSTPSVMDCHSIRFS